MIRGVRAAKRAPSWQDLRAVYPPTAICGAFRIHGAHILPKPARFGCTARESCRELAILPSEATFGMHGAQNLPWVDARERIAREYCHCQSGQERIRAQSCHRRAPGNASRHNLATTSRPRTHFAHILPSVSARERMASISCHRQTSENAQFRHTSIASCPVAQRSPREGVGLVPWLCCGVRRATLSPREGVDIPPSRGLTAGNDFESALFRWATMSPLRVLQSCAVLCAEAKSALTFM